MSEQRQLLEDYIVRYDEAVLAAIVRRHGPMVNDKGITPLFRNGSSEGSGSIWSLALPRGVIRQDVCECECSKYEADICRRFAADDLSNVDFRDH